MTEREDELAIVANGTRYDRRGVDKGVVHTRLCANGCTIYLPPKSYGEHHIERHYHMYLDAATGIITLVPAKKLQVMKENEN